MPPTSFLREVKSHFEKPVTSATLCADDVNRKIVLVVSDGCVDNLFQLLVVSFPSLQYSLYALKKL